jgi:uncharacterized membrane protein YciS (DUF1049 family)
MENFLPILLASTIAFSFVLVLSLMYFVFKVKQDQLGRQQKMVEQAKINHTLKQTVDIQSKTIENYQEYISRL